MQNLLSSQHSSGSYLEIKQRQNGFNHVLNSSNQSSNRSSSAAAQRIPSKNSTRSNNCIPPICNSSSNNNNHNNNGNINQISCNLSRNKQYQNENKSQLDESNKTLSNLQSFYNSCGENNKENISFCGNSHQSIHSRTFNYETSFHSNSLQDSFPPSKNFVSCMQSNQNYNQNYNNSGNFHNLKTMSTEKSSNFNLDTRQSMTSNKMINQLKMIKENPLFDSKQVLKSNCSMSNLNINKLIMGTNPTYNSIDSAQDSFKNYDNVQTIKRLEEVNHQKKSISRENLLNLPKQNSQKLLSSLMNEDSMQAESVIESYLDRIFSRSIQAEEEGEREDESEEMRPQSIFSSENNHQNIMKNYKSKDNNKSDSLMFSQPLQRKEANNLFQSLRDSAIELEENSQEDLNSNQKQIADLLLQRNEAYNFISQTQQEKEELQRQSLQVSKHLSQSERDVEQIKQQLLFVEQEKNIVISQNKKTIAENDQLSSQLQKREEELRKIIEEKKLLEEDRDDLKKDISNIISKFNSNMEQLQITLKNQEQRVLTHLQKIQEQDLQIKEQSKDITNKNELIQELQNQMQHNYNSLIQRKDEEKLQFIREKNDSITQLNDALGDKKIAYEQKEEARREQMKLEEDKQELIIVNQQCESKIKQQWEQLQQMSQRINQLELQQQEDRNKNIVLENTVTPLQEQVLILKEQIDSMKSQNQQLSTLCDISTSQAKLLTFQHQSLLKENNAYEINCPSKREESYYSRVFRETISNVLVAMELIQKKILSFGMSININKKNSNSSFSSLQDLSESLMNQVFEAISNTIKCLLPFVQSQSQPSSSQQNLQQYQKSESLSDLQNVQTATFGGDNIYFINQQFHKQRQDCDDDE